MEEYVFNLADLNLKESSLEKVLSNNSFKEEGDKIEHPEKDNTNPDNSNEPAEDNSPNALESGNNNNETETPSSDTESGEPDEQNTSSIFSALATVLKEEGVLSVEEEDLKNIKSIKDLVETLKSNTPQGLTESQKRYLEAVEAGVPLSDYERMETEIENLKSIDDNALEDVQLRFELIAYDFMDKGIPKEKAIDLANRSVKLQTDLADAKEALNNLIISKENKYKEFIENKKKENQVNLEKLREKIYKTDSVLKDIKLTDKQKDKIFDLMTVKVDVDRNTGKPINEFNKWYNDNREDAELILNTLYFYTNKFKDLSKLASKAEDKKVKELEQKLKEIDASELSLNLNKNSESLKGLKFNF